MRSIAHKRNRRPPSTAREPEFGGSHEGRGGKGIGGTIITKGRVKISKGSSNTPRESFIITGEREFLLGRGEEAKSFSKLQSGVR